MLSLKLPSWQEKCCDITNVPDTVMSMIEGLATTPEQSPLVERCNRVSVSWSCVDSWHQKYTREIRLHVRTLYEELHSIILDYVLLFITDFDTHLTIREKLWIPNSNKSCSKECFILSCCL